MTMSFWTAAVIIVAMGVLSEMYRARLKADARRPEEFFESLSQRMARLEDRMVNLETIVIEKEKRKAFSDLD